MQPTERSYALDAVRAFALLWGIFFHAAMSFIDVEMEDLDWTSADSSQSTVLFWFVVVSHWFRMPLFFFIAGYFAHLMYHRKGAAEFARNRTIRIAVPFVVGWCVVAPLLKFVRYWGQSRSGTAATMVLWPSPDAWAAGQVKLTHLWFLYYLCLVYIVFVGTRHFLIDALDRSGSLRGRIDAELESLLERGWAPIVLSLPISIVAMFVSGWNPAEDGMPTPDRSLIPQVVPLVGYGIVFTAGWIFQRAAGLLQILVARIKASMWLALIAFVFAGAFDILIRERPTFLPVPMRFVTAIAATALMWYFNFGLIGYALKRFASPSRTVRYVADASYWLYIAHLPVVCALQVWVAQWPLHWTLKYSFIVAGAFAVLFPSYHYLVRFTFIGAVLNGRRSPDEAAVASRALSASTGNQRGAS